MPPILTTLFRHSLSPTKLFLPVFLDLSLSRNSSFSFEKQPPELPFGAAGMKNRGERREKNVWHVLLPQNPFSFSVVLNGQKISQIYGRGSYTHGIEGPLTHGRHLPFFSSTRNASSIICVARILVFFLRVLGCCVAAEKRALFRCFRGDRREEGESMTSLAFVLA